VSPRLSRGFSNELHGSPINVKETRSKSKQMLGYFDHFDYNSDHYSFKKGHSPTLRDNISRKTFALNTRKTIKKKKYIKYLRIDIRNLKTDDSSSLLITDEFKKDLEGKAAR
jgi:hypothetical protein